MSSFRQPSINHVRNILTLDVLIIRITGEWLIVVSAVLLNLKDGKKQQPEKVF